ncbi:hypothetical protein NMG60_11027696 [Bertholletia excelsa]
MDSPETTETANKVPVKAWFRLSVLLLFSLVALLSLSFLLGFAAAFFGNLSVSNPISVPSQCRIVSSSVDLRSSKVCELGLLNYKAKNVFSPFERKKFRCRYDYYWASVFKVEYKDHSGQTRFALAEAPNEALPLHCRPNFGAAWLTKDKFKVNETYDCWYTYGFSKVNIYHNNFFNCKVKDPSTVEMLKRYFFLSMRILESWFISRGKAWYWKWEAIAGVVTGFSTSLISITLIRILQQLKSYLCEICSIRTFPLALFTARLKQAFLFVAYFSFLGWLTIRNWRQLGLRDVFRVH